MKCIFETCICEFDTEEDLNQHIATAYPVVEPEDPEAKMFHFSSPQQRRHWLEIGSRHYPKYVRSDLYTCNICNKRYSNIKPHLKRKHQITENFPQYYTKDIILCEFCNTELASYGFYGEHLMKKHINRKYCENCGEEYYYCYWDQININVYPVWLHPPRYLNDCKHPDTNILYGPLNASCAGCGAKSIINKFGNGTIGHPVEKLREGCKRYIWEL